ncbi:MAG: ABC transporter permease [Paludibacter sp.]|nr:ABC transporter permease [Paludibacter sp.]
MNQFLSFIRKETWHILRDVYTLVTLLIMPVALLLILGYAVTNDMKNTPFVVLDADKSMLSSDYIKKLNGNKYFSMVDYVHSENEIENAFKKGLCKVAIVFAPDFENSFIKTKHADIQLIIDSSDPNEASSVQNYLQMITMEFQQEKSSAANMVLSVVGEVKMLYNPQIKSAYNFVPGLMGMLMMIVCALMTSISIVREKERGTMEVLLISPLHPSAIILAKAVPYFIISMIDVSLILLIGHFIIGVPIVGNLLTIFAISVVFTLAALSLGMLISSVAPTQQIAMQMALLGLLVPSMLLSGVLFPIDSMPKLLQYLSNIIPARWYIEAMRGVMIKGVGMSQVLIEVGVLVFMTVFLLFISIKNFKVRLAL